MRSRAMAAVLVLAFAAACGYLAWVTLIGPPAAPRYFAVFEGAGLASPDPEVKNLYLRRVLYLSQRPRHAWLQVAAHDRLRVYVNGELLAGGDRDGLPVAVIVDLIPYLEIGRNVIAITARQSSMKRPPAVAVTGEYTVSSGQVTRIDADGEWRVSSRFEHLWPSPEFPDRHWPAAAMVPLSIRSAVAEPPRAVTTATRGAWITPTGTHLQTAVRREFVVQGRPARAWLRLAASSPYRLAINGLIVDEREEEIGTDAAVQPARRTYDVTTFLRRGPNVIALLMTRSAMPPRLHADLEVESDGGSPLHLATDSQWISRAAPQPDWMERDVDSSQWQACRIESGDIGFVPWSLPHQFVPMKVPADAAVRRMAGLLGVVLLIAALAWIACRFAARRLGPVAYLATVPATIGIGSAILLTYDPRLATEAMLRPLWLLLAVLSVPLQWIALARAHRLPAWQLPAVFRRIPLETLLVVALVGAGFSLRIEGIRTEPLQWDEVEHYEYTRGFLERGFPSREVHRDLPIAYVHTSELIFVPSALVAVVTDDPRLIMRLPAVFWSVLSIVLVYVMGRRLFTPGVGLVAAAVLAFAPVSITMATVGRYFSQLQFFTLLVVYALWLTVEGHGPLNRKALAVTALAFVAMYLTWEGSAFLAIGLALAALMHRRERLRTVLFDAAVWAAVFAVAIVLVLQYSHTVLQQTQFLWYGTSLSDLRIRPMWNYPTFRPWFYVWASSWSLDALLPIAGLGGAIVLSAHHAFRRPLQFLLVVYLSTCLFMATLLPAVAWRYIHHLVPLLVLLASASLVAAARSLLAFARPAPDVTSAPRYAHAIAALAVVVITILGSGFAADLREMTKYRVEGFELSSFKFPDLQGPSRFVRDRLQPGDVVLATDPFQVKHFMGLAGERDDPQFFWPASTLQLSATLDDRRPIALDRRDGTPAITDLASLRALFTRHDRIWYVVQPARHENQNVPEVSAFLRQHMDIVYEDFEAVVLLRDRNHRGAALRFAEERELEFGRRHRTNFPPEPQLR